MFVLISSLIYFVHNFCVENEINELELELELEWRRGSLVINGARNGEESSPCYHYFEVHGRQSVGGGDRGTRPPQKKSRVEDTIGHLSPLPKFLEVLYFVE